MMKLGRIDIITEISLLLSHVALPREGHVDAAIHVMAHVGQRYNSRLMYDSSYPEIDHSVFNEYDWSEYYMDAKEAIPMNASEPQGKGLIFTFLLIIIMQGQSISQIKKWLLKETV